MTDPSRCPWPGRDPLSCAYHDREWGVPLHDDRAFFELLVLEGAQAGLSWLTILRKREAYRRAFDRFDPRKVARYDDRRMAALLTDAGIVRNRLKITAAVRNARAFLDVQGEFGSFDACVWGLVGGRPKRNAWTSAKDVPAKTPESDAMSRDLGKRVHVRGLDHLLCLHAVGRPGQRPPRGLLPVPSGGAGRADGRALLSCADRAGGGGSARPAGPSRPFPARTDVSRPDDEQQGPGAARACSPRMPSRAPSARATASVKWEPTTATPASTASGAT
jgi:DNA-3-methyladenine glycosylase I